MKSHDCSFSQAVLLLLHMYATLYMYLIHSCMEENLTSLVVVNLDSWFTVSSQHMSDTMPNTLLQQP